jgi:hypothetical protein
MGDVLLVLCLDGEQMVIHLRFVGEHSQGVRHALELVQGRVGTGIHQLFGLLHGGRIVRVPLASRYAYEEEYPDGYVYEWFHTAFVLSCKDRIIYRNSTPWRNKKTFRRFEQNT